MTVTITRDVAKRCPYKDEMDIGTVTIVFDPPGYRHEAPELHGLGEQIDAIDRAAEALTHEAWTDEVRRIAPDAVSITSTWSTGPWAVTVTA